MFFSIISSFEVHQLALGAGANAFAVASQWIWCLAAHLKGTRSISAWNARF